MGGCAGEPPDAPSASVSASSSSGGASDAGPEDAEAPGTNHGQELFAELEADFFAACGTCHDAGGIADTPFLAGPDRYRSVVSWPGVVVKNAKDSLLLTYPVSGGKHSGKNLDAAELVDTLLPRVVAWLEEESKSIGDPVADAGPSIVPFSPILGFNAVYLDALGADFEGMAITFTADELGEGALELTQLEVHPTKTTGVHVVHPLFVVYHEGTLQPDPDPVDSFSNIDETYPAGEAGLLGPGVFIVTNWERGAKLSIAFEKIEAVKPVDPDAGTGDGGIVLGGGCKDVDAFVANAKGPLGVCQGCHGGANGQATAAVDMTELDSSPAAACAQVKNRVDPLDPPSSQIFVTTDPNGNAAHPYKFMADVGAWNAFKSSVIPWIEAEK